MDACSSVSRTDFPSSHHGAETCVVRELAPTSISPLLASPPYLALEEKAAHHSPQPRTPRPTAHSVQEASLHLPEVRGTVICLEPQAAVQQPWLGSVLSSLEAVLKPRPLLPQGPIGNGWDKPLDPVAERIHLSKWRSRPQATGHKQGTPHCWGAAIPTFSAALVTGQLSPQKTQELCAFILHSCDVNTGGPKPGQISRGVSSAPTAFSTPQPPAVAVAQQPPTCVSVVRV